MNASSCGSVLTCHHARDLFSLQRSDTIMSGVQEGTRTGNGHPTKSRAGSNNPLAIHFGGLQNLLKLRTTFKFNERLSGLIGADLNVQQQAAFPVALLQYQVCLCLLFPHRCYRALSAARHLRAPDNLCRSLLRADIGAYCKPAPQAWHSRNHSSSTRRISAAKSHPKRATLSKVHLGRPWVCRHQPIWALTPPFKTRPTMQGRCPIICRTTLRSKRCCDYTTICYDLFFGGAWLQRACSVGRPVYSVRQHAVQGLLQSHSTAPFMRLHSSMLKVQVHVPFVCLQVGKSLVLRSTVSSPGRRSWSGLLECWPLAGLFQEAIASPMTSLSPFRAPGKRAVHRCQLQHMQRDN